VCHKIDLDKPIRVRGSRIPNPKTHKYATFGAQSIELEVDIETGEVNILRSVQAHEWGKALNTKLVISQTYGGAPFGVGYALTEEDILDPETGKMLNNNLLQYGMPTSLDIPLIEDAFIVEDEDPFFAYSASE